MYAYAHSDGGFKVYLEKTTASRLLRTQMALMLQPPGIATSAIWTTMERASEMKKPDFYFQRKRQRPGVSVSFPRHMTKISSRRVITKYTQFYYYYYFQIITKHVFN